MGDYRTTAGESMPMTKVEKRRRTRLTVLIVIAIAAATVMTGTLIRMDRSVLASGYVTTEHYAEVRPATIGVVAEILASSGQNVEKGEILVRLDSSEEVAALEEIRSRLHEIEAELARREAEIGEEKRELAESIEIAKLRLENASTKLLRTRELIAKGLMAASALEDQKLKEELSRAELTSLLSKDKSIFDKEIAVLKQQLDARQEAVKRAETRVRSKEIRAPISGQILRYEFVIGELVRPETVLYEIFGGDKQILKLRVAERYATRVAPGQKYEAELAPYRGLQKVIFTGEVVSLRNVIQKEGQKSYRVAYCTFDPEGRNVPPGTTGEAKIFYGTSIFWLFLFGLD